MVVEKAIDDREVVDAAPFLVVPPLLSLLRKKRFKGPNRREYPDNFYKCSIKSL
jgi:hypothetical protein